MKLRKDLPTIPCQWCGMPTNMLATRHCDWCYSARIKVEMRPSIIIKMLKILCPHEWAANKDKEEPSL